MKLLKLTIAFILSALTVFGQEAKTTVQTGPEHTVRRSSVSLNLLPMPLGGFNVFYEKPVAKTNQGLSIGFGYANFRPILSNSRVSHYSLTGEYKFYVEGSDFYVSPYAKYRLYNRELAYAGKETWNQLGIGGSAGFQHIFKSGFLIQSFLGLGVYSITHQLADNENLSFERPSPIDLRLGLSIGFALK